MAKNDERIIGEVWRNVTIGWCFFSLETPDFFAKDCRLCAAVSAKEIKK